MGSLFVFAVYDLSGGRVLLIRTIGKLKNEENRVFDQLDMGWTMRIGTDQEKQALAIDI